MPSLTARFVESVKAKAGRRLEIADDLVRGLSLRVAESGAKAWALRYRTQSGQQRRLTLGAYPALSLASARDEAIKALGAVAVDRDPAREKQTERRNARLGRIQKPQTVWELWLLYEQEKLPAKRDSTAAYQSWLWTHHLKPRLGLTNWRPSTVELCGAPSNKLDKAFAIPAGR